MRVMQWLRDRTAEPMSFLVGMAVTGGMAVAMPDLHPVVPLVFFGAIYVTTARPTEVSEYDEQRVTGVVKQTIRPEDVSSYAIWGELLEYAEENDLALHTVHAGWKSDFHRRLSKVPVVGRFAKAESVHIAHSVAIPEGEEIDVPVRQPKLEKPVPILEVST